MANVVNIAAYRFAPLDDLPNRRAELKQLCQRLALKGTILLSREGVNLFVAGDRHAVDELVAFLREDPLLEDLEVKESLSDHQPFHRMLVRLKKEIIAFGIPDIDPRGAPAPAIAPAELKQWLDEGRDVVLLDTRNDYEVKLGAFRNAVHLNLKSFRDFPAAAATLGEAIKTKPVVMYCTGGIRCEKAGPFLQQQGFQDVYQLEGGILKYFEQCGGQHYDGECFVFDQRVAVSPALNETDAAICFVCQSSLTASEQQSPLYVPGESCPFCHQTPEEKLHQRRQAFAELLQRTVAPLPGATPYDHRRPMNVPARFDGLSLLEMLVRWHPHVGREHWREECRAGRLEGERGVLMADSVVRAGERIEHLLPAISEPDVSVAIELLFEDDDLVVLNKPAPLPMHSGGRYHRNTLMNLLQPIYKNCKLRAVHRLDANTSGVVVCAEHAPWPLVCSSNSNAAKSKRFISCWWLATRNGTIIAVSWRLDRRESKREFGSPPPPGDRP